MLRVLHVLSASFLQLQNDYKPLDITGIQKHNQETQSECTNREVTATRQRSRAACKPEPTGSKCTPINMPDAACSHEPKLPQSEFDICTQLVQYCLVPRKEQITAFK